MFYSDSRSIVDPQDFAYREEIMLPCSQCVLTFGSRTTKTVISYLENHKQFPMKIPLYDPTLGEFHGRKIFVATLNIGAPASTLALELLIASGAKQIIVIGAAGSIRPDVRIGDIFIPTWGIREEGTSYHYMPPDYIPKPDKKLADKLRDMILETDLEDINVVEGGIWSIDAVFRETIDKIRKYREQKVIGVDMESTALMTVAHYRKVSLAIVHIITDELKEDSWTYTWGSERAVRGEKIVALASLKTLATFSNRLI